jgi:hypothetical protein
MKSSTDKELPSRPIPNNEMEEPYRAKPLRDNVLPSWKKSSTDKEDASRGIPKTDSELPRRMNERSDIVDPK